eukprot:777724_1
MASLPAVDPHREYKNLVLEVLKGYKTICCPKEEFSCEDLAPALPLLSAIQEIRHLRNVAIRKTGDAYGTLPVPSRYYSPPYVLAMHKKMAEVYELYLMPTFRPKIIKDRKGKDKFRRKAALSAEKTDTIIDKIASSVKDAEELRAKLSTLQSKKWVGSDPNDTKDPWHIIEGRLLRILRVETCIGDADMSEDMETINQWKLKALGADPACLAASELDEFLRGAALAAMSAKAKSDYYNEFNVFDDSLRYQYQGIDSAHSLPFHGRNHYHPLISGEYNDASGSESSLLIGGVFGASAVVVIMMIFCIGLACGMLTYWGYSQKKALEERKKEDWRQSDNV